MPPKFISTEVRLYIPDIQFHQSCLITPKFRLTKVMLYITNTLISIMSKFNSTSHPILTSTLWCSVMSKFNSTKVIPVLFTYRFNATNTILPPREINSNRVLVNSKFGVLYSNFLSLTPSFCRISVGGVVKLQLFLEGGFFAPVFKILVITLGNLTPYFHKYLRHI